jgi:hypothetical protein
LIQLVRVQLGVSLVEIDFTRSEPHTPSGHLAINGKTKAISWMVV